MVRTSLVVMFCLVFLTSAQAQDNWPRFRGGNADGVGVDHEGLPLDWSNTDNVAWVADIPGWGWASPVVWGDKVFVTTVVSEEENTAPSKGLYLGRGVREPASGKHFWKVYCFAVSSGNMLWEKTAHVGEPKVPRHPKSTYAAETPVTDGKHLYVLFGDLGLFCYDFDGSLVWSREIEPKKTFFDYGAAASPVVHENHVIVVYDNQEASWIASYDADSGSVNWKKTRDETHSWATPFVWKNEQRTEIVVPGKRRNRSYSLDGDVLWQFDGQMSNLVIPSPFAAHGMCYIASGYVGDAHRPTFAIVPGAQGDITPDADFAESEFIRWYQGTSSSYNPSQLVYGDYMYTLYDQGFLTCHDARTGEVVYGKKRFSPAGSFTSSPFAYNGHVFCLSEDGLTYAVKAGREFEIIHRNELNELCLACPAIVGGNLLVRTASKLYCLREGAKLDPAVAAKLEPRRPATGSIDLWKAASTGNRAAVLKAIQGGANLNGKRDGSTALVMATLYRRTGMIKLLIDKGADVSIPGRDGNTPLHIASFFGYEDVVDILLDSRAPVDAKNSSGETAKDLIDKEWSEQTERTYQSLGGALGLDLKMSDVKSARPRIVEKLSSVESK